MTGTLKAEMVAIASANQSLGGPATTRALPLNALLTVETAKSKDLRHAMMATPYQAMVAAHLARLRMAGTATTLSALQSAHRNAEMELRTKKKDVMMEIPRVAMDVTLLANSSSAMDAMVLIALLNATMGLLPAMKSAMTRTLSMETAATQLAKKRVDGHALVHLPLALLFVEMES